MQYREFGKTGLKTSVLGFGMMRMQKKEDGTYDEAWTTDTLRSAIDRGLNYVDTAYIYGESERLTGNALQDGYREKVILATKLPVINMTCEEDFDRLLNEQLERLQTDHIDVYLLHALSRKLWDEKVVPYNVIRSAEKALAEGKIRHLGFSFHDDLDAFRYILDSYDKWEFCQIQLNYMDVNYQAGLKGLEEAHARGLAVVIMEPLRGGSLANVTPEVAAMLPFDPIKSALSFLWDRKEVTVVLSGMSTTEQVQQNLELADQALAGALTDTERKQIIAAGDCMRQVMSIPCTGCGYCDVCPQDIAIPQIFAIRNRMQIDGARRVAENAYKQLGSRDASSCISCGACMEKCPQHIDIPKKLAKVHTLMNE